MLTLLSLLAAARAEEPAADAYVTALERSLVEDGATPEEAKEMATAMAGFEATIPWQTGAVSLEDGAIRMDLRDGDRYAGPVDASRILEAWGNPPDTDTQGLLLPRGAHLFGDGSWAVLVRFAEDGWVDDAEAAELDYDEVLEAKQAGEEEGNRRRRELGLSTVALTGWAEAPHYDAASHVLYWATLLREEHGGVTLNYDVRVLGRRGVLSLNALADEGALATVKQEMESVRGLASFQDGHRYADYVPGVDAKAAYGIAALVAGGAIAAKTGLLKGLLVALLASKKLLVGGAVAVMAAARSFFGRLTGRGSAESSGR